MAVNIVETDNVAIAWLHKRLVGSIFFPEHDFGSLPRRASFRLFLVMTMDRLVVALGPYEFPLTPYTRKQTERKTLTVLKRNTQDPPSDGPNLS